MDFKTLNQVSQLEQIDKLSENKIQLLFKHSTRCSVSSFALRVLNNEFNEEQRFKYDLYYLDLLNYRPVSDAIAIRYGIEHESPQLLAIKNGVCIYYAAHSDVSLERLNLSI